jgi:glycosyltransferase involved in cell wall biosynthesis/SAM-dependent methyltransferase
VKVLMIHNRYRSDSPSGENRVVDQESEALTRAGHEVRHFERESDDIDGFSLREKAAIPGQVVWSPSAAREIGRVLRSFKPDVVHLHNHFPLISPSVLHPCRRHLVPVVVTFHNYRQICPSGSLFRDGRICHDCVGRVPLPSIRHGCYRGSSVATIPLAVANMATRSTWQTLPSAYVFISNSQRQLFSSLNLPDDRCFVKHNLVYSMNAEGPTEPLIVYLARLDEAKGLPLLMEAWDRFTPDALRLVIAGSGPLDADVKDWASVRPSVEYAGLLNRDQCFSLLAKARAAVVPSQCLETFGLVVAEAMSVGVPSIASAHGALPELITDGVDGVLFPPRDAAALAKLFGEVERDPERFAALGREGRRTYARRFEPHKILAQLEAIYRFAIEHPVWIELKDTGTPPSAGTGLLPPESVASSLPRRALRRQSAPHPAATDETDVAGFWESHPCGDEMIGGLVARYRQDFSAFFEAYDKARYELESHIPGCLDALDVSGKKVLEIGLGQGAESEQLIRRGARWTGLDLTKESVRRVEIRLALRDLEYEDVLQGSATRIPVDDNSFDLVFSHGVLHHVPDIRGAQGEIHRVLRPDGRLVVMLYARRSLNYQFTIKVLRRAALLTAWPARDRIHGGLLGSHLRNAERDGLLNYLQMDRFVHANTDGPLNPYALVYDIADVRRDFPDFEITGIHKEFMHAPPLPVHRLPGARLMGWHLWVEMKPVPRMVDAQHRREQNQVGAARNDHSAHLGTPPDPSGADVAS